VLDLLLNPLFLVRDRGMMAYGDFSSGIARGSQNDIAEQNSVGVCFSSQS
jgi:hypothetical protein